MINEVVPAVGAFIDGAWSNINANSANAKSKKNAITQMFMNDWLAQQQYKREVDAYKHRYEWTRQSLKEAGYNQALAFMNGGNAPAPSTGGNASGVSAAQVAKAETPNLSQFLQQSTNARLADYQELLAKANSAKAVQETANLAEENPYISKKMKSEIAKNQALSANALAQASKAQMETDTGWKVQDYKVSQEFGKAAQELYNGRLSDVSADFLNNYGITRQEAFRLGEDGLKVLGGMVGMGMGKKALGNIANKIIKSGNSAKSLSFANFPK